MAVMVYICDAVLEKAYLESSLQKILAGVPYAVFCCDAAYINFFGVEQFKDFSKRLSCIVFSFKSGILFDSLVASFVESELLACVWKQVFMNLSSTGAGYAVGRPYAAEFHE